MNREEKLQVKDLTISFRTSAGKVQAVRDISFDLYKGETLAIVGESGSGKSLTSLAVMGLVPKPHGRIEGNIFYHGRDLLTVPAVEMRALRGKSISMIFQEPMTSLNPVYTIGEQIVEAIRTHEDVSKEKAFERAVELLRRVGVPAPEERVKSYPHQLSGGMRQRAMIAMALSCSPELLIADEPTTALDVTIQAQILDLILQLQKNSGMSVLLITHALGVVAETADRVAVMYGGHIVEIAATKELFERPMHPYTLGLLRSIPRIDKNVDSLYAIPGMVPAPRDFPVGCKFAGRCSEANRDCFEEEPELLEVAPGHFSRCRRTHGTGERKEEDR